MKLHRQWLVWHSALVLALLLLCAHALASVTASISGTVKDTGGAAIVGATVKATNVDTGIVQTQHTNGQGYYSFQELPLGNYNMEVEQSGFKAIRQTGLVLDVNAARVVDVTLEVGAVSEKVTVTATALHVETANTQLGEVIGGSEMTSVPLVTRSYTDLLALQPGVVSQSSGLTGGFAGQFQSAGFALPQVSGDENAGNLSVNGMREASNGFILNGAAVQETGFGGAAVVPNLDSIAEFRILTNNFDAEYGNYSGGQINVVSKAGANQLHGSAFEFLRNTDFDAANFFDAGNRGAYHQNQFGGTLGGPIRRDKVFYFADYQENRKVVGVSNTVSGLPSTAEEMGDFSALATGFAGKTVNGANFATVLSNRLGYAVAATEPYFFPGCSSSNCVFPGLNSSTGPTIPQNAWDTVSKNLLADGFFPPAAQNAKGTFSTSSFPLRLTDRKTSGRVDANTSLGMVFGYYYFDQYSRNDPYWPSPGPLVPGYNVTGTGRTNLVNLGDTKTVGATGMNELRLEFLRIAPTINKPAGGTGKSLSDFGFTVGGQTGITPLGPQFQGVPEIDFNSFVMGVPSRVLHIYENTYQMLDNFSKVIGTHTVKFGGNFHYNQMTENLSNVLNGNFGFGGGETGVDFADFLIGAPNPGSLTGLSYEQGQAPPSYGRNHYAGFFGQDSWRVHSQLTLNYGLRWEFSTPWSEKYNEIQTFVPALQSKVFPGSPTGWVFPGDPGIPSTLAPTRYNNFAPRIGLAYSPTVASGILGKLTGGPGHTSIRAGYGIFYTAFEGSTNFNEIGDAPFGNFQFLTNPVSFDAPWQDRTTGNPLPQAAGGPVFPVPPIPHNISAKNPDNAVNWGPFLPLASSPGVSPKNRLPYAENYELSIQRQFSAATLLTVSYVGTQGHRLLATLEANPGSPALCRALNALGATPTCGPLGEGSVYVLPAGVSAPSGAFTSTAGCPAGQVCVDGTRTVFDATRIGSNGYFITMGNSGYNSLQVNLRHTSHRAQVLVGYTFSKSIDDSSGYGEQINPVNPRLSRALSAFDVTHNFVASYNYSLPFEKLPGPKRLTNGWALSGITSFSTGLPVTLVEMDDHSLLGTFPTGPQPLSADTPDFAGGSLGITDPRKSGGSYFNPGLFTPSVIGAEGNAARRFFHGPGINNWNMSLLKDTKLTETVSLQFRAEFYNLFNHAQFGQPGGILGSGNFGSVTSARDPRIGQVALKLLF